MARIPLVDSEDLPPEYEDQLEVLSDPEDVPEQYRHLLSSSTRNVFRTIGHLPGVLELFRSLGGTLWAGAGLSTRQRELLVLSVAREVDSAYIWHQHVRIALSDGLSEDEVLAIADADLSGFPDEEAVLGRYAAAFARGDVDDELHADAAEKFDDETLVGIGLSASYYLVIARLMDGFDVELEEPFAGWELENV